MYLMNDYSVILSSSMQERAMVRLENKVIPPRARRAVADAAELLGVEMKRDDVISTYALRDELISALEERIANMPTGPGHSPQRCKALIQGLRRNPNNHDLILEEVEDFEEFYPDYIVAVLRKLHIAHRSALTLPEGIDWLYYEIFDLEFQEFDDDYERVKRTVHKLIRRATKAMTLTFLRAVHDDRFSSATVEKYRNIFLNFSVKFNTLTASESSQANDKVKALYATMRE